MEGTFTKNVFSAYFLNRVSSALGGGLRRGSLGTVHTSGSHPSSFTTSCASTDTSLNHDELNLSRVRLFVTPRTAAHQASLSISKSQYAQTHIHQVGDAIQPISSSVILFSSCLQSFPASGSFPMSQFFTSGGQSIVFQLQHQSLQ